MKHKHIVRCEDKMCFPINPITLDPVGVSCYDPWCFSDPKPDTIYHEFSYWSNKRTEKYDQIISSGAGSMENDRRH